MSTESPPRAAGARAATASLILLGLLAFVLGVARPAASAPAGPTDEAHAALDWLAVQLEANGGSMQGFTPGSSDWGLTADAVLAFVAAGRGSDVAAQTATDQLAGHLTEYTTWDPDITGVRVAGATGKVLLTLHSQGRDTSNVGGVDLEAELRSLMVTTGSSVGRFADRVPDPTWDTSNGFGQALSMLALAHTDDGVPAASVDFLVAQQCPSGGFRLTYAPGPTCAEDPSADIDATALALQALLAVAPTPSVDAAAGRALAWLLARQDVAGGFGGTGPTAALNSNSTGVAAQALRAAGRTTDADAAAQWIASATQLSVSVAAGTPAAGDAGAIGYDPAARASALTSGITTGTADQWRRATTQATLALGLAPYAPVLGGPVTLPTTSAPTTTPTTTAPATPVTVAPDGVGSTPTTSAAPSGATAVAVDSSSANAASGTGSTSGAGPATAARSLAVTGNESAPLWRAGLVLTFVGAVMAGAARRVQHR